MSRINTFLELAVNQGGSDLHLVSGQTPRIRINGILEAVRFRELSIEDMERIFEEFMSEEQVRELRERQTVDLAHEVTGLGRFRVSAFRHAGGLAAVLRLIDGRMRTLDALGIPPVVKELVPQPKGLTLVTGPTGSGKSTTLAAIVDQINATRRGHIITIEDPIEFLHEFRQCVVTQREVGPHVPSFAEALRSAVREDPDVIMVGEMRDLETIRLALTAAETGIQVVATLHTNGAVRCVDRIINVFPERQQEQVRTMLSESLRLVVSQQLVRLADGSGRVLAAEVPIHDPGAAAMIRSGQTHKLGTVMQSGLRSGMQMLDLVLRDLVRTEVITGEEAHEHAVDKASFEHYLGRDAVA